jgi:hypothetical protein
MRHVLVLTLLTMTPFFCRAQGQADHRAAVDRVLQQQQEKAAKTNNKSGKPSAGVTQKRSTKQKSPTVRARASTPYRKGQIVSSSQRKAAKFANYEWCGYLLYQESGGRGAADAKPYWGRQLSGPLTSFSSLQVAEHGARLTLEGYNSFKWKLYGASGALVRTGLSSANSASVALHPNEGYRASLVVTCERGCSSALPIIYTTKGSALPASGSAVAQRAPSLTQEPPAAGPAVLAGLWLQRGTFIDNQPVYLEFLAGGKIRTWAGLNGKSYVFSNKRYSLEGKRLTITTVESGDTHTQSGIIENDRVNGHAELPNGSLIPFELIRVGGT